MPFSTRVHVGPNILRTLNVRRQSLNELQWRLLQNVVCSERTYVRGYGDYRLVFIRRVFDR